MEQWIWLKNRCEFVELMVLTTMDVSVLYEFAVVPMTELEPE